jgi:hypothetical protein
VSKPHKAEQVFRILMSGFEIEDKGEVYVFSEANELCVVRGDTLLKVSFGGVTLTEFIRWAEKLPEETVTIALANLALNKMKGSRGI